jgi:hypothetical protein
MEEILYVLRVGGEKDVQKGVAERLGKKKAPSHVRVSTLAPLSNHGFPQGAEGALIGIGKDGLIVGVEGDGDAPSLFVPWQNVAYLADAAGLGAARR